MQCQLGSEIISQNHADVYPSQGVDVDPNPTSPERRRHIRGSAGVASADQHLGKRREGVSVAQEDDIEALSTEQSRGGARGTLPPGTVQHFHHDPLVGPSGRRACGG